MAKEKWLVMIFLLLSSFLNAQVEKIDTDRPDQTESVLTVPAGWLQCELGFAKERFRTSPHLINIWTLPTLLTRYGLSERWELRMINEYEKWGNSRRLFKDTFNFLPLQLGFKVNLLHAKGIIPEISLLAHTGFNRIASEFGRGGSFFSPSFSFAFQNPITENFAIGYNFGAEWDNTYDSPTWLYTLSPGFNLGEKWYAYIEAFGFFRKNEPPEHLLDGGVSYCINSNMKVDASAGFGISPAAPKNYLAIGFSFRCNTRHKK
jgi:Putative MetA-pathway of phenol degradation